MTHERLIHLINQYAEKRISADEMAELNTFLSSAQDNLVPGEMIQNWMNESTAALYTRDYENTIQEHVGRILSVDKDLNYTSYETEVQKPVRSMRVLKHAWFKYAAAVLLILTGIAVYYIFSHTSRSDKEMVQTTPSPKPKEDILPGSDRAILTLSNGQQVQLNNATSETIKDGALSIENINGQLSYSGTVIPGLSGAKNPGSLPAHVATNTMTTPRGGQYKLTLSDGTNVWLNAASSITYPIAFTSKTREVSITGEAYFEVSKNKEKPFIVTVGNGAGSQLSPFEKGGSRDVPGTNDRRGIYRITVLGTHFNVNSYPGEKSKTSLLEGSIKINNQILTSGQAYTNGTVIQTNTAKDIAWKNGSFYFEGTSFQEIAKQLERWYDIEIKYVGNPPVVKLRGEMDMGVKLSGVCRFLNQVGIATEIKDKTLIISKAPG